MVGTLVSTASVGFAVFARRVGTYCRTTTGGHPYSIGQRGGTSSLQRRRLLRWYVRRWRTVPRVGRNAGAFGRLTTARPYFPYGGHDCWHEQRQYGRPAQEASTHYRPSCKGRTPTLHPSEQQLRLARCYDDFRGCYRQREYPDQDGRRRRCDEGVVSYCCTCTQ